MLQSKSSTILRECAMNEHLNLLKPNTKNVFESVSRILDDIQEVDESVIAYNEEMINVHQDGGKYLIEFDNLAKYMRSNECTAKTALDKICEHYDISVANTYVVIESVDTIKNQFKQAQVCAESSFSNIKSYGIEEVNAIANELDSLIESGIKLLAKPSYNSAIQNIY